VSTLASVIGASISHRRPRPNSVAPYPLCVPDAASHGCSTCLALRLQCPLREGRSNACAGVRRVSWLSSHPSPRAASIDLVQRDPPDRSPPTLVTGSPAAPGSGRRGWEARHHGSDGQRSPHCWQPTARGLPALIDRVFTHVWALPALCSP